MATQNEIADFLNLTDRQVRNLQKKGVLPQSHGRAGVDLKQSVRSYITYLKSDRGQGRDDEDEPEKKESPDDRLKRLRADALELKLQVDMGRFAPVELLADALSQVVSLIKPKLAAIPSVIRQTMPDVRPSTIEKVEAQIAVISDSISSIEIAPADPEWGYCEDSEAFAQADEDEQA